MANRRVRHGHGEVCREAQSRSDLEPVDTAGITANALCTCWSELKELAP